MTTSSPNFLIVGQISRGHGVRGDCRLRVLTNYPERIHAEQSVYLATERDDPKPTVHTVERARMHRDQMILKLTGIDDRDAADLLRGQYVMIDVQNAVPLDDDEYYFYQLIGLAMYTDGDEHLGEVTDIIETGANEVYVVNGPRYGEVLIPAIESVVQTIDLEAGRIIITPLPGLLPDLS